MIKYENCFILYGLKPSDFLPDVKYNHKLREGAFKMRLAMVKKTNTAWTELQMPHSAIKIHENRKSPQWVAGERVGLAVKRQNENQMGCWLEPGINWEHSSCELRTRRWRVLHPKCQATLFKSLWARQWTAPGGRCRLPCVCVCVCRTWLTVHSHTDTGKGFLFLSGSGVTLSNN